MRHSCSGGRTGSRLGAGWEPGPSPCSGERKEAVGRGGAEASEVSCRQRAAPGISGLVAPKLRRC